MSSSREFVACFKLIRSVALSRLRLLNADISFCSAVAMLVSATIWPDRAPASWSGADLGAAVEPFVTSDSAEAAGGGGGVCLCVSASLGAGAGMFCSASIVADCGGVFSPRMLCDSGRRTTGRTMGVRLGPGTKLPRWESLSGDVEEENDSRESRCRIGVVGRVDFSGDSGEEGTPSIMKPRSRTLGLWRDCIRRWEPGLGSGRSGDTCVSLLGRYGSMVGLLFSRAFSVRAACADWIVVEVPGRDGLGDWGFNGRGGGALSGSELSHLLAVWLVDAPIEALEQRAVILEK